MRNWLIILSILFLSVSLSACRLTRDSGQEPQADLKASEAQFEAVSETAGQMTDEPQPGFKQEPMPE